MSSKIAATAALIAAAAVSVPAALAGMHPVLGARLAGMGEHGVVNLHLTSKPGKVCWAFDLKTKGITGASIHAGTNRTAVLRLGKTYTAKGCTAAGAMVVEHLESAPAKYTVWVDTKGHPGDLRGKLFAGRAHM